MNRIHYARSSSRTISLVVVVALLVGCAQVNTTPVRRYRGPRLEGVRAVVVYDFEPTGESIGLLSGRDIDANEDGFSSEEELANRREVGRGSVSGSENCFDLGPKKKA